MMHRLSILPFLILATACSAKAPPPTAAAPALWKIADADTTIYLFGTIHALPTGLAWRDARIDRAIAGSNDLVLETVIDRTGTATLQTMLDLGMSDSEPPLLERVPADKRDAFAKAIAASGYPPEVLDRLESWAAGFVLTAGAIREMGIDAANGVEEQLTASFKAAGKPITGLETVAQQLGYFDGLPEDDQRRFLAEAVEDPRQARREYDAMLAAWRRGDETAISATFDEEMKESPRLRQVLLIERNRRWADWIKARLAKPGTVFVAVGAGHLAGKDSVITDLQALGETPLRVP
jgi:uncharacterized protein YbaP (TraB family)